MFVLYISFIFKCSRIDHKKKNFYLTIGYFIELMLIFYLLFLFYYRIYAELIFNFIITY